MLKEILDNKKNLQIFLYDKGFLVTNKEIDNLNAYPFYNNWQAIQIGEYFLYTHKNNRTYVYNDKETVFFLIGHAFNPYKNIVEEKEILENLSKKWNTSEYRNEVDELTGIFLLGRIEGKKIYFEADCSGIQNCCYGKVGEDVFITSHMRLIGDLIELKTDNYVEKLIHYRWYHLMLGNYLPGNITCYKELKRLIPNTVAYYHDDEFNIDRIYPYHEIKMAVCADDYNNVIRESAQILKNTLSIIPQKWGKPAISLTGGIDSNTTFAAANDNYDKYTTFSYISMDREKADSDAADVIAKKFNVTHKVYEVPLCNDEIEDFEIYKQIFIRNDGNIGSMKDNDVRKKITLIKNCNVDVEVKSWVSETIRAYIYKYFGRTKMPKSLSPRQYTSIYKIFLGNRNLCRKTDKYFKSYLKETKLKEHLYNYDESDLFVWEMEHGGKCSLDIGVMKSCFDICIPYNNRRLLDTLLAVPLKKRINDEHHLDLKKILNKELYDMNIRVINLNETKKRKKLINIYYIINSKLPF